MASRTRLGRIVQYCGVGHGMCTKCWMRTSGSAARTMPGTQYSW